MVAIALAILFFMLLFMLLSWECMRGYASTYDDSSWWLGTDSDHRAGDVDVIYTYPNITQATKLPTVGVTLKYIKNEDAHADWVIFSNVSVYISSSPAAAKVATSNIHTSKLVRPSEQYSDSFPITSIHPVNPGKYLVFLKWRALFDLGDSVEPYNWDAALYYNQSYPLHIDINDLPPITVKNQDHNEPTQQPSLVVEVKRPLGVFNNLTKVYIDKKPYELIQGKVERLFNLNYRTTVEVPKNITDINGIKGYREIFVSWSFEFYHNISNTNLLIRFQSSKTNPINN
jgi:hypothetical protein